MRRAGGRRRYRLFVGPGLISAVLCVLAGAGGAAGSTAGLVLVGHFDVPVNATAPPGVNNTLYVVEQTGRILVWQNGTIRAQPFLDISSVVKSDGAGSGGEQGLLSMAFDPSYARNHYFYVDYTDLNGNTRVVRYRAKGGVAVLGSAKELLFVQDFAPNHNGGQLQFGPDGLLYWSNGDGGGEGDPQHTGQDLTRPFARIERLNVRVAGAHWKLVAYGLRNPWRFSFDRTSGDLYIGDVGQDNWEEIDYLPRGTTTVANFGWSRYEGNALYDSSQQLASLGTYVPPIYVYPHSQGCAVIGGYAYRGSQLPSDVGRYFFGDYCSGNIWSLTVVNGTTTDVRLESAFNVPGLSSFAQDNQGELYAMSVHSGNLYRLQP